MAKLRLTAKTVEKLTTDRTQEDFWDTLVPGLHLRVSGPTGRKTWLVRYRSNGAQRRIRLGWYATNPAPDAGLLGLADARERARRYLSAAAEGGDLVEVERQERAAREAEKKVGSVEAMAREVLKARARKGRGGRPTRERTQRERARILEREILPHWGQREAGSISRRDVVLLVDSIADRGAPVLANRVLSLTHLLFNDAVRRGFPGVESNPAHLVEAPGVEAGRDRYLDEDEISAVWAAMGDETLVMRGAWRLALLSAQRIGSVLAMRWDGIQENGQGAIWRIPPEDFKGAREHLVPLSPEAMAVIQELRDAQIHEDYVFPSREGCKKGHITNPAAAQRRIRARSKIEHWTAHDFRTTFRTWATRAKEEGGLGVAGNVADAVLGHAENTLGWSRYQGDRERYLLHEKGEALRAWGEFVAGEGGGR